MSINKSLIIVLRVFFVVLALQFIKDAFYKWDGYSFYMTFVEFLPDLSLSYILWVVLVIVFSIILWLLSFIIFKVSSKVMHFIGLEHIIFILIFAVLPLFIKRTFYSTFSISHFVGLERRTIFIIVLLLVASLCWFLRNRAKGITEKILYGVNSRITPLVWLFSVAFIIAIPVTFLKNNPSSGAYDPVISENWISSAASQPVNRPNIILVVMDSLFAGDMQLYGYGHPTTPFISDWAEDAVIFSRHYAASNYTTPATMSLLTGQRVWTHGVWYMAINKPVGNYEQSLPHVLSNNGYAVHGFVQNGNAHPVTLGLQEAFLTKDHYITFEISKKWWYSKFKYFFPDRPIVNKWIFSDSFLAKRINSGSPASAVTLKPSELVYDRFFKSIWDLKENAVKTPYFAYIHVMPPHYAYLPPEPFMGWLGDEEKYNTDENQWRSFIFNKAYDSERQDEVDVLRKRYDEFILYSDKQFELFLSRLYEVADISNTIIILTSDHGESFGHEWLAHVGPHLYEPLVHVPLIIKLPETVRGKVVDMAVDQVDIAPTVLELAGIDVPSWIEGRSLVPLIKGEQMNSLPVFSAYLQKNRSFGKPISKGTVAVWMDDYKLIHYLDDKKSLLFNVKLDFNEQNNVIEGKPDVAKRLTDMIYDELAIANERIKTQDNN